MLQRQILFGVDLNSDSSSLVHFLGVSLWGCLYERRQDVLCAAHGVRAVTLLWSYSGSLSWQRRRLTCNLYGVVSIDSLRDIEVTFAVKTTNRHAVGPVTDSPRFPHGTYLSGLKPTKLEKIIVSTGLNQLRQGSYGAWRSMFEEQVNEAFDHMHEEEMAGRTLSFNFGRAESPFKTAS